MLKACAILFMIFSIDSAYAYTIDWKIGNRFRAFDYLVKTDDTAASKRLFDRYTPPPGKKVSEWMQIEASKYKNGYKISPYSAENRGPWNESSASYDKDFVKLPKNLYLTVNLVAENDESLPAGICDTYLNNIITASGSCSKEIIIEEFPSSGASLTIKWKDKIIVSEKNIKPELKIILGLGDSYGSGEGSPDKPTKWRTDVPTSEWPISSHGLKEVNGWVESEAEWYSDRCNRSYFSAQSLSSLKFAADNPHSVVSFVHLACAGAGVVDGILAPQRNAPGSIADCRTTKKLNTPTSITDDTNYKNGNDLSKVNPACDVPFSQLNSAVNLLCKVKPTDLADKDRDKILNELNGIKINPEQRAWINDLRSCPSESLITPDLVLLSIGGNDIGFGGVVAWGLVPHDGRLPFTDVIINLARNKGGVVCPDKSSGHCGDAKPATFRLDDLDKRYKSLRESLITILGVSGKSIIASGYTNPLFDKSGNELCGNELNSSKPNEWKLCKLLLPPYSKPKKWQFNLTGGKYKDGEATLVNRWVIPALNNKIDTIVTSKEFNWRYADVSTVMNKNGWCTDIDNKSDSTQFSPDKVYEWNPLADRTRMIRTANDSVMTQWRSNRNHDFLYGLFHPNVQGYAGMSDRLFEVIDSKD